MPVPTVPAWIGNLSDIGIARETAYATPLAATDYVPFISESLELDPGLLSPELMRGQRDVDIIDLYGEQKIEGQITLPLYADVGHRFLGGVFGLDYTTGSTPGSGTTLTAAAAVGATSVSLASATGYAANGFIQLGPASAGQASEVHKILSVSANTVTFAAGEALVYGYASGVPCTAVTSPFTHTYVAGGALPSYTIEKNLGNQQSVQYAGCLVNKAAWKLKTNSWAEATYDMIATADALIAPSPPSIGTTTQPFALADIGVSLFGAADIAVDSVDLNLDNMIKSHYSFSGQRTPTVVQATGRKTAGKFTAILGNTGMTYYTDAKTGVAGSCVITLAKNALASLVFTLPRIKLGKPSQPVKNNDLITQDIPFIAFRDPVSGYNIQAQAVNSLWLVQ